jgi:CubicO group peptidase (beta-lactamase class C family)
MAGGGIVEDYWPTEGWRTSTPEDQEMDGTRLQAALESAQRQRLSLHGVVVIRHGYIVLEKYFASNNATSVHSLYSCTKSFVSALVGIAIDKRLIADVNQPVVSFFPDSDFEDPDKSKQEITIENLLTMSSGLNWLEADETYERMYTTYRDWVEFVLDLPMVFRPGLIFNYSSGCSHLLSAIIQKTSDKGTYDFARSNLFKPLGIKDPTWERDPSGIPIGGWGLSLSPRDMAKLGYLYLHGGKWERNQIVPASWVRSSTQPHIKADGDWQYGYQWWVDPSYSFYAAIGRYGQSIFVVPGLDLVVVFTAHIDSNDPETDLLKKYIIPACSSLPRNPPAGGKILQEEHGP